MDAKRDLWSGAYRLYQEWCREAESAGVDYAEFFIRLAGEIKEKCAGENEEGKELWKCVYTMIERRVTKMTEET